MNNVELVLFVLALIIVATVMLALLVTCAFLGFQLYRFAKIIMVFEDDLLDVKEAAEQTSDVLVGLLQKPMFFDSPEVKKEVEESMEVVRYLQLRIHGLAVRFTERSKQQYTFVEEDVTDTEDRDREKP